jgi:hypothetical protein
MSIKYIDIFQSKALPNNPKWGFLVRKETIWQPWPPRPRLFYQRNETFFKHLLSFVVTSISRLNEKDCANRTKKM